MSFIQFCRRHNVGGKIDWIQKNFFMLLLLANLMMTIAAYRNSSEAKELSEEASRAAHEAAEAAHEAAEAANEVARAIRYR